MLSYIAKRILLFFPALFALTLIGFFLRSGAPSGRHLAMDPEIMHAYGEARDPFQKPAKPLFYCLFAIPGSAGIRAAISDLEERDAFERLLYSCGSSATVRAYRNKLLIMDRSNQEFLSRAGLKKDCLAKCSTILQDLRHSYDLRLIGAGLRTLSICYSAEKPDFLLLQNYCKGLQDAYKEMVNSPVSLEKYIPEITFTKENQYHYWVFGSPGDSKGIVRGDFGLSSLTGEPVIKALLPGMLCSAFFILASVLLAFLLSLPVGVYLAAKGDTRVGKAAKAFFMGLYSLPAFFVAVLLLFLFANPEALDLFPSSGLKPVTGFPAEASLMQKMVLRLPYLVLPLIAYTYSSFVFLGLTIETSLKEELNKDYITTARAKGLPYKRIIYRHALRNAAFPLITILGNLFPAIIGGSVLIETIFSIPGMGNLVVVAAYNQDYSMLTAILTWAGMFTLSGFLLSDILYCIFDPRARERLLNTNA